MHQEGDRINTFTLLCHLKLLQQHLRKSWFSYLPPHYPGQLCLDRHSDRGRLSLVEYLADMVYLFLLGSPFILSPSSVDTARASQGVQWQRVHCQCRRIKRPRFSLRVGKILWSRKWQPTTVFLPGGLQSMGFSGQDSLRSQRVGHD